MALIRIRNEERQISSADERIEGPVKPAKYAAGRACETGAERGVGGDIELDERRDAPSEALGSGSVDAASESAPTSVARETSIAQPLTRPAAQAQLDTPGLQGDNVQRGSTGM